MRNLLRQVLFPKLRQLQRNHSDNFTISYAQCGEDIILQQLFMTLGIPQISYLDVGAHHPTYLSNTYFFYHRGGSGVCIEPDPVLFEPLVRKRPRDIHLNCGVGVVAGEADFFIMSTSTLNTFSKEDADRYVSYGQKRIVKIVRVRLESINDIIQKHFPETPHLVSLDIEGLDYKVIQSFDFKRFRPAAFCVETLSYTENKSERKLTEIIDLMLVNGYMVYADTYINTIFVDNIAWKNRAC